MRRRRVLALFVVSALPFAGCLGSGMPHDAVVRAVRNSRSEREPSVSYDGLPRAERQIARTAVEEELYHACPELPAALRSFADRFDGPDAYLAYRGTAYALWIRIADVVFVSTASPPEEEPSCGFVGSELPSGYTSVVAQRGSHGTGEPSE